MTKKVTMGAQLFMRPDWQFKYYSLIEVCGADAEDTDEDGITALRCGIRHVALESFDPNLDENTTRIQFHSK